MKPHSIFLFLGILICSSCEKDNNPPAALNDFRDAFIGIYQGHSVRTISQETSDTIYISFREEKPETVEVSYAMEDSISISIDPHYTQSQRYPAVYLNDEKFGVSPTGELFLGPDDGYTGRFHANDSLSLTFWVVYNDEITTDTLAVVR